MKDIKISTEYIKLDQFIKFVGCVSAGSDAKEMILEGFVKVNDEVELRRGKKLRTGDVITIDGVKYKIE